jgi:hypothetical protein
MKCEKIEKIEFVSKLKDIEDIFDDNLDVIVTLENGHNYVVIVATIQNILTIMNDEKLDFLSPGEPMIIVRKLTKEVIEEAIQAYAEDEAYYLKFYSAHFDIKTLNVLKERSVAINNLPVDVIKYNFSLMDFDIDTNTFR